jgi:hypothetical protein
MPPKKRATKKTSTTTNPTNKVVRPVKKPIEKAAKKQTPRKLATKVVASKKVAKKQASTSTLPVVEQKPRTVQGRKMMKEYPLLDPALIRIAEEAREWSGEKLVEIVGRAAFMCEMEGTTLEEALMEARAWAGIEGDDIDEWAEIERCKCGRRMPNWWNRKAYPYSNEGWRFYLWATKRCACGFAPEEIIGAPERPKARKR